MIDRFKMDTAATQRDRNDARADRFGKRAKDAQASFQTLEQVHVQIGVFERYLRNAFLVLTGAYYSLDAILFQWDWECTARDMADLIVLGGISEAVSQYGVAGQRDHSPLQYWVPRTQFWKSGAQINE